MHIEINQSVLSAMLAQLAPIADRKSTMPALSHIHLSADKVDIAAGSLTLTANDLETGLQFVTSDITVHEPGAILLPGKKLHEIVREMPSKPITIQHNPENNRTVFTCGATRFELSGLSPEDFPLPADTADVSMEAFDKNVLHGLITHTSFAASTSDSRLNLNAVCLFQDVFAEQVTSDDATGDTTLNASCLRAVATDGHRLANAATKSDSLPTIVLALIPLVGAEQVRKFLEKSNASNTVEFGKTDKLIMVRSVNETGSTTATLSIRLLDGTFPDVDKVIPKTESRAVVTMDKTELVKSIKRVALLAEQRLPGIRLVFENNTCKLLSQSADLGTAQDEVACDWNGEAIEMIVNADYLLDGLNHIDDTTVTLTLHSDGAPVILKGKRQDGKVIDGGADSADRDKNKTGEISHFNLVMPMRK
jgi:DNA polymerase-3 subunit beta